MRAALDCFAARGFTQTTIGEITERADLGHGTFYQYFTNKDDLLLALVAESRDWLGTCLIQPEPDATDLEASLSTGIVALLDWFARNRAVLLALREAVQHDPAFMRAWQPAHVALEGWITDYIESAKSQGIYRRMDERTAAGLTIRLLIGVAYDFTLVAPSDAPVDVEQIAAATARYCANALFQR